MSKNDFKAVASTNVPNAFNGEEQGLLDILREEKPFTLNYVTRHRVLQALRNIIDAEDGIPLISESYKEEVLKTAVEECGKIAQQDDEMQEILLRDLFESLRKNLRIGHYAPLDPDQDADGQGLAVK